MTIGRGTTPKLTFTFVDADKKPIGSSRVNRFFITLAQGGAPRAEKSRADCAFDDAKGTVSVRLSQRDTLALEEGTPVELQWRALLTDGTAIKSNVVLAGADRALNEEVLE